MPQCPDIKGSCMHDKKLSDFKKACDDEGINMVSASLRWVLHHSYLSAKHGDGIICKCSGEWVRVTHARSCFFE